MQPTSYHDMLTPISPSFEEMQSILSRFDWHSFIRAEEEITNEGGNVTVLPHDRCQDSSLSLNIITSMD
jgi:hypothetical protein